MELFAYPKGGHAADKKIPHDSVQREPVNTIARFNGVVFPSPWVWLSQSKVVVPSPIPSKDRILPKQDIAIVVPEARRVPPKGANRSSEGSKRTSFSLFRWHVQSRRQ